MNNKPVAWIKEDTLTYLGNYNYASITIQVQKSKSVGFDIPLYTHPVKELHLSLQKEKETGELLAVTYTDDEHRIVEVLWQRPPAKELTDEEIAEVYEKCEWSSGYVYWKEFAKAVIKKAREK